MDVHRVVQLSSHCLQRLSTELVGLVNALSVPVCPVQLILKKS